MDDPISLGAPSIAARCSKVPTNILKVRYVIYCIDLCDHEKRTFILNASKRRYLHPITGDAIISSPNRLLVLLKIAV